MKLALTALTLGALGLSSTAAHADAKSWAAFKGHVTPKMTIAVSVDFVPMRKLDAFNTFVTKFIASKAEIKQGLDLMMSTCSLDLTKVVTDVSVVIEDGDNKGAIAIGYDGVDRKGIEDCLGKLAATKTDDKGAPKKITQKKLGAQTQYTVTGETEKLHLTWVGKNVVVIATDPMDPKSMAFAVGKSGKSQLNTLIAKANVASPVWFAVAKTDDLPTGGKMNGVVGKVDIATDTLTAVARIITSSAADATTFATEAAKQIPAAQKQLAKAPDLAKVLGTVTLKADGADVEATGSVAVKSLPQIVQQVMANM